MALVMAVKVGDTLFVGGNEIRPKDKAVEVRIKALERVFHSRFELKTGWPTSLLTEAYQALVQYLKEPAITDEQLITMLEAVLAKATVAGDKHLEASLALVLTKVKAGTRVFPILKEFRQVLIQLYG
jgi:hypothetical protein